MTGVTEYTYLEEAVQDRLVPMVQEIGAVFDPPITLVTDYPEDRLTPPYWWVYMPPQEINPTYVNHRYTDTFRVALRCVVAYSTSGYDGYYDRLLYSMFPTTLNYLRARRMLVYADGQNPPRWLDKTEIPSLTGFGKFEGGHIGFEIQLALTFTVNIATR